MTAQFHDKLTWRGVTYDVLEVSEELFFPVDHGLLPSGSCSACWRGFVSTYSLEDDRLELDSLGAFTDYPAPVIFGVPPTPRKDVYDLYDVTYHGLHHPLPLTGHMTVGRGFVEEFYEHMGFAPAWKYQEAHVLRFEAGRLAEQTDISAKGVELRDLELARRALRGQ